MSEGTIQRSAEREHLRIRAGGALAATKQVVRRGGTDGTEEDCRPAAGSEGARDRAVGPDDEVSGREGV